MDPKTLIETRARAARATARAMALCPTKTKNEALQQMARGLVEKSQVLLEANRADVERAPPFPIRWAPSSSRGAAPTASRSLGSACLSA